MRDSEEASTDPDRPSDERDSNPTKRRGRRRRRWLIVVITLVFLVINYAYPTWLMIRPVRITVGKETTYFVEPLDDQGFVDYPQAVNRFVVKPVPPEGNAAIDLLLALGGRDGDFVFADECRLLGVEPLPPDGDYFRNLSLYGKDIGQWNESDVQQRRKELDEARKRPWSRQEYPELAKWLDHCQPGFATFAAGSAKPGFYLPRVSDKSLLARTTVLYYSREFASGIAARAMLKANDGAWDEAWQDLMSLHRFALLLEQDADTIACLTASAVERIAADAETGLFYESIGSDVDWDVFRNDLSQLPARAPVESTLLSSRAMLLDSLVELARGRTNLQQLSRGEGPTGENRALRLMDWDTVLKTVNQWYDRIESAYAQPSLDEQLKAVDQVHKELVQATGSPASWWETIAGQVMRFGCPSLMRQRVSIEMGDRMVALFGGTNDMLLKSGAGAKNQRDLTRLCLEVAAHRDSTGSFPESMQDLNLQHINVIDHLTGKSFVYKRTEETILIYSVGVNGEDEGGPNELRYFSDDFGIVWTDK